MWGKKIQKNGKRKKEIGFRFPHRLRPTIIVACSMKAEGRGSRVVEVLNDGRRQAVLVDDASPEEDPTFAGRGEEGKKPELADGRGRGRPRDVTDVAEGAGEVVDGRRLRPTGEQEKTGTVVGSTPRVIEVEIDDDADAGKGGVDGRSELGQREGSRSLVRIEGDVLGLTEERKVTDVAVVSVEKDALAKTVDDGDVGGVGEPGATQVGRDQLPTLGGLLEGLPLQLLLRGVGVDMGNEGVGVRTAAAVSVDGRAEPARDPASDADARGVDELQI